MRKMLIALVLCTALVFSLATASAADYKIGFMTGSVSQGEENYRIVEKIHDNNPDVVEVMLFPDKAATEQETTISNALSLAADPDVKAIIFSQAVQGTAAACQKIREIRPDILLIAAGYSDDAASTAANCDVFFHTDTAGLGKQMVDAAHEEGVENVVHYSFPRHLAMQVVANRLQVMKDTCAEYGMNLIEATTPDPMSDAGTTGTQQFVLEDVPRIVDAHGVMTTFFGTNIGQQEPMIKKVVETKSYYTSPSDPSPFGAYPNALGIEAPADKSFDIEWMMNAISEKLAEVGMTGHMGAWKTSVLNVWTTGAYNYAVKFCEGQTKDRVDYDALKAAFEEVAQGEVQMTPITDNGVTYDNGWFILCEYYVF